MRSTFAFITAALLCAGAANAAPILSVSFDNAPLGTAPVPYAGYAGDLIPGGTTINTSDPTGPGDPDLPSAGVIADVATVAAGFAGTAPSGRCLQLAGSNGYYIALPADMNDYRVSVKVAFTQYPGASAEYGITNVISHIPGLAFNENWELRGIGQFGTPPNCMQLMYDTAPGGGDNSINLGGLVPATNRWYDMAVEYVAATDVLKAVIDGATYTITPGFGSDGLRRLSIGYWASDANTNRDVVGLIDDIVVDDLSAGVPDWTLY